MDERITPGVEAQRARTDEGDRFRSLLYYHRTQALYEPGDKILRGNWGRIILGTGPDHNRFYPEYVLERVRAAEFASKPARMKAAFAFESFECCASWSRGKQEYIYAVRLEDPSCAFHRGDMTWIDIMPQYRSFDGVEHCARRYWSGEEREPGKWEIIAAGDLLIEDRLTKVPENGWQSGAK